MRDFFRAIGPASWAVIAVCVVLILSLGWCAVTAPVRERTKLDASAAAANTKAQATDLKARDLGADERVSDLKANTQLEKDLTHAVSSLPDARPSDRRVALGCQRLRNQGTRPSDLPPVCRPEG